MIFREATLGDLPAILDMLRDDLLGQTREGAPMAVYEDRFRQIQTEPHNQVIVGEAEGRLIATYQLTLISGLSLGATRRAQLESVRVLSSERGRGIGHQLIADAETRARAAGCGLLQLTMNRSRTETHRFYEQLGFTPSHVGFKREL